MPNKPTDISRREFLRSAGRLLAAGALAAAGGCLVARRLKADPQCPTQIPCRNCAVRNSCSLAKRKQTEMKQTKAKPDHG